MENTDSTQWDHTVDLLIVGSGAGAMTAALAGYDRGAETLLIENRRRCRAAACGSPTTT